MSARLKNQTVTQFGKDTTGTISYKFNKQGFRSDIDFDIIPDYAFFGCSLVFGIGVPGDQIFASYFTNSQNYGLAGNYNNSDIFSVIDDYIKSDLYSPLTKIIVVWTDRNTEQLDQYYQLLSEYNIIHFFCGNQLSYNNCYAMPAKLDLDVSGTHMGPNTHRFFWKLLCQILKNQ